jgi:acyl-coenzyme A synthetase/AMP-(fatty) acid ligase
VVIEHHALSNFVLGLSQSIGFGPRDTHIAVTTLGFDISILELFMPLCYGARVVVASQEETMDREKLSELIRNRQANSMQATPSHWGMIVRDNHASLRNLRMLSGGEGLRRELAEELRASAKSLYNMYGPTEATIWASMHEVGSGGEGGETGGIVTIGRPLANYRMYVLDENLEPVPQGVVGELYIAGDGLARGYLNQAGLNGERFICEPFTGEGGRMYWTGDLARWSGDGRLEFVGRADQQVKVRGYRIELGEIEVRLEECAWVKEAVAVVRYEAAGEKRLVAYYTVKGTKDEKRKGEEGERLEAEELRAHLAAKLPEYMVPGAYVRLDRLPLTGNGKLDRKSLPAPEGDAYARGRYEAPEGETETAVAGIWAEVLKVERVGRHDNFFAVGGHSLLAIRVIARLQQALGVELKIGDLFARPVLASLSERIVDMQLEKFDLPDLADLLKELKKN